MFCTKNRWKESIFLLTFNVVISGVIFTNILCEAFSYKRWMYSFFELTFFWQKTFLSKLFFFGIVVEIQEFTIFSIFFETLLKKCKCLDFQTLFLNSNQSYLHCIHTFWMYDVLHYTDLTGLFSFILTPHCIPLSQNYLFKTLIF